MDGINRILPRSPYFCTPSTIPFKVMVAPQAKQEEYKDNESTLSDILSDSDASSDEPLTLYSGYRTKVKDYLVPTTDSDPNSVPFRLLRDGAILLRQLLCANATLGNNFSRGIVTSDLGQEALFWSGLPLYFSGMILPDAVANMHRLLFVVEVVCRRDLTSFGKYGVLLLLALPLISKVIRRLFFAESIKLSTLEAGVAPAADSAMIWPLLGKFLNQYLLMKIPYYRWLVEACTGNTDDALWFGNLLGCFLLLVVKDVAWWLNRKLLKG
ncbi:AFL151Wp [Eremothecium gossypii ATCC 10895]|uniref:AFL151Wp n=1 Tax=Eremothecium gossypii (strain ATCC 10895 / CBS 109.51 / FGSC 9923 / NRRL Y-1056) TaxID=284811 RepID=Q755H4_EREGS|nr:AFL151Wp [Eremothecium gossypii ATCC 10895]AAS53223.2 AFL151Wp [Eremothecium gossypii ATCC 10895]